MTVSESVLQDWVLQDGVRYLVETTEMWHFLSSCSRDTRTSDEACLLIAVKITSDLGSMGVDS